MIISLPDNFLKDEELEHDCSIVIIREDKQIAINIKILFDYFEIYTIIAAIMRL